MEESKKVLKDENLLKECEDMVKSLEDNKVTSREDERYNISLTLMQRFIVELEDKLTAEDLAEFNLDEVKEKVNKLMYRRS